MKIYIFIIIFIITNNLYANYIYKIPFDLNQNIDITNELSTDTNDSNLENNENSEENINEWALFLQKNSNSYDLNTMQTQSRDSGGRPPPTENPKMPLEDIATIIRGSDARINLGASFDTPDIYNPLVFPTVQGLNNTIKEIVFYHNTFNVTGMGNVKVIKEDFIINFSGATSYENLSNLIKIGGDFALLGFNNNSVDLSFLRNLQSVNNIVFREVNPLNISSINKNLIMNDLFIDTSYIIPEEDAYWIRDKLLNGTIKNVVLEKVGNSELLLFEGLEKVENIKISYMNNLLNLEGLNNLITSKNIEIINNNNLTSIENLSNLTTVETLDLSNNSALISVNVSSNKLTGFNIKNGANSNISAVNFKTTGNTDLTCINVDDVNYAAATTKAAATGKTVWSDRSATGHSNTTNDWLNGFKLDIDINKFLNESSLNIENGVFENSNELDDNSYCFQLKLKKNNKTFDYVQGFELSNAKSNLKYDSFYSFYARLGNLKAVYKEYAKEISLLSWRVNSES